MIKRRDPRMVTAMIVIRLDIEPQSKRAAQPRRAAGKQWSQKHPATAAYENAVAARLRALLPADAMAQLGPLLSVEMLFVLPRPKARPKWCPKWNWVKRLLIWAGAKPDWDNYVKATQDALTRAMVGLVDDGRFVVGKAAKMLCAAGGRGYVVIRLWPAPKLDALPAWVGELKAAGETGGDWMETGGSARDSTPERGVVTCRS